MFSRVLPAAFLIIAASLALAGQENGATNPTFPAALDRILAAVSTNPSVVIPGVEGWLFFQPELRHLSNPSFRKMEAVGTNVEAKSPLTAILDFKKQLDRAGISLLVVPVPAKASVYPDKLIAGTVAAEAWRTLNGDSGFCRLLESNGVGVLDLTGTFRDNRDKGLALYCSTDSHWSPEGIRIAADAIASRVTNAPWFAGIPKKEMLVEDRPLTFTGDLETGTNPSSPPETVTLHCVSQDGRPVPTPRESPVLLLGDSHDLVFHSGGEMHAEGSGLPDLLAAKLGFPLDVVAVLGSGATPARRSLARRKDNLAGKKLVIWCFSARDFTEAPSWEKVPVIR